MNTTPLDTSFLKLRFFISGRRRLLENVLTKKKEHVSILKQKIQSSVSQSCYTSIICIPPPLDASISDMQRVQFCQKSTRIHTLQRPFYMPLMRKTLPVIRCARKIAKSDYQLRHNLSVHSCVCPSSWNNSDPIGRSL